MKKNIKDKYKIFWIICTTIFILQHAIEINFLNPLVILGLIIGLSLALISHFYSGKIAIFLLITHMCIEAINNSVNFEFYYIPVILLHLVNDTLLLYKESSNDTKNPKRTMILTGILLIGVVIISKTIGLEIPENTHEPIEAVVMSGMLGCVLHFFKK